MANRYWVGGTGTWDLTSTANWSASSGGASGASVPTASDDVFFDANSFSSDGQTVTIGQTPITSQYCNNFNLAGIDREVNFSMYKELSPFSFGNLNIRGNLLGSPKVTWAEGAGEFVQTSFGSCRADRGLLAVRPLTGSSVTIQSNGMVFNQLSVIGPGSEFGPSDGTKPTVTLLDDLVIEEGYLGMNFDVIFDANDFNVTASGAEFMSTGVGFFTDTWIPHIHMGSGAWNMVSSETYGGSFSTSGTVSPGFSPIIDCDTSSVLFNLSSLAPSGTGSATISIGAYTALILNNVNINGGNNNLNFLITISSGSFRAHYFNVYNSPITFKISNGAQTTFDFLRLVGSSGNLIDFRSGTTNATIVTSVASSEVQFVRPQDIHVTGAGIPIDDTIGGVDGGNNLNWLFPSDLTPTYDPSVITAVHQVQQNLSFPQFIIGGQDENYIYALFKKTTEGRYSLWRSKVYQIGTDFDVQGISFNLLTDLSTNTEIIPTIYFDDESTSVVGTTINNTNYSNNNKLINLTAKNFGNQVHGKSNFFIEFQFTGSDLAVIGLPIFIDVDIQDT